jgi:2-dehydro-3-deoxyphosphogluconate aldolase/(4S)-4-hydroxy-2-oxoglutarate aldolase
MVIMQNHLTIINAIISQKVLPLYNHADIDKVKLAIKTCYDAGLKCFEFTNRNENAPEVFDELKKYCVAEMKDVLLGVGTIKNIPDAEIFRAADFLVSPYISQQLVEYTVANKLLWIPGCSTTSEIAMANNAGIKMVKIFPANLLGGPAFIKTMKDIFPAMKMIATGGMKADKIELNNWFDNGVDAVGIGGQLFGKDNVDVQHIHNTLNNIL